jgi:acetyl-CoA acyltransferase
MDNVYVVAAKRTAVGKSGRGALANVRTDDMAGEVIKTIVKDAGIQPEQVQDVVFGCSNPEAQQGMNVARMAAFCGGLPDTVPAMTINRFCSSGLEAQAIAAGKIEAGLLDIALAGGLESMSLIPMAGYNVSPNPKIVDVRPEYYISMGCAGDGVAHEMGFTREQLDEYALNSQEKALDAIKAGRFKDEIVPLEVPVNGGSKTFDTDEGPRPSTLEALAGLRPAFGVPGKGLHTPGNSSQTSDGAAAVILMSEKAVKDSGAKPLAKLRSYSVAAATPRYLGPAQPGAIKRACELAGIKPEDVGVWEINEAFAAVALCVIKELGLDPAKVNVNGGAIALGHPLGCTGAKLTAQIINEMKRRGEKYGVVTMCIGGGQGAAGVFELVD